MPGHSAAAAARIAAQFREPSEKAEFERLLDALEGGWLREKAAREGKNTLIFDSPPHAPYDSEP